MRKLVMSIGLNGGWTAAVLFVFLVTASPCFASNYYIAQKAQGAGDGSSCANARPYNWNWAGVTANDTVYICGTIGNSISIQASGTSGNPVTLKFCKDGEANCGTGNVGKFSAPYWGNLSASAIYSPASCHDIVIDGNNVGVVEATNNGDLLTYQKPGSGLSIYSDNTEVKNLIVQNIYVHVYGDAHNIDGTGIWANGCTNLSVHDCSITHAKEGITYANTSGRAKTNINLYNNTISYCSWGLQAVVGVAGSTLDPVNIYNNDVLISDNWMGSGTHNNGSYCFSSDGLGLILNLNYWNNYFHTSTSHEWYVTGVIHADYGIVHAKVYNNLIVGDANGSPSGGGYITVAASNGPGSGCTSGCTAEYYNNTVIGNGATGMGWSANTGTLTMRNNIIVGTTYGTWPGTGINIISDNNLWYNNRNVGYTTAWGYMNLSQWQTALGGCPGDGNDCKSIATDPALFETYMPNSESPVIGAGANLTNLGITKLNVDKDGNARPASGAWDIGAYQYTGAVEGKTVLPASPSNVRVVK